VQTDGVSLVPLKLYWKDNHVKLELGVGKGKKNYDKRQTIKARDLDRKLKKNKY
jgi:SsrA-binding protein